MNLEQYAGIYRFMDMNLSVQTYDQELRVAFPGVPAGFEVVLSPLPAPHTFRMESGPAQGGVCVFQVDERGQVTGILLNETYDLSRLTAEQAVGFGSSSYLPAPSVAPDGERERAFKELAEAIITRADGRLLAYDLPYPKYEFLCFMGVNFPVLFHGSNSAEIDEFKPLRHSFDRSSHGNLQAVYATHNGIWPMYFAIINREKYRGSLRNGVLEFENDTGDAIEVYQFSINKEMIDQDPWQEGTIYILPRQTFTRLRMSPERYANEWASEVPVRPLARLSVVPEDFPFLGQVWGHDDSQLLRIGELQGVLLSRVRRADPLPEGFRLELDWDEEGGVQVLAFITLQRQQLRQVRFTLRFPEDQEPVTLDVFGPPAYRQVLENKLLANKLLHEA